MNRRCKKICFDSIEAAKAYVEWARSRTTRRFPNSIRYYKCKKHGEYEYYHFTRKP